MTILRVIAALCCVTILSAQAADISGYWRGKAKGIKYLKGTIPGPKGDTAASDAALKTSMTITAKVMQDNSSVNIDADFETSTEKFAFSFNGNAGNLSCWGTGARQAKDGVENAFLSGHFPVRANKLEGTVIIYKDGTAMQVTYMMKKVAPVTVSREAHATAISSNAVHSNDAPFNVAGTSKGKTCDMNTTNPAVSFKGTLTGTFTPATSGAILTFSDGSASQMFAVSQYDAGKALALSGSGGSESIILAGPTKKGSTTGTGWVYSATTIAEFKFKINKKK